MRKLTLLVVAAIMACGCGGGGSPQPSSNPATPVGRDPLQIITGVSYDAGDGGENPRWVIGDFNKDGLKDIFLRYDPQSAFSLAAGTSPVRFFLGRPEGGFEQNKSIFPEGYSPTLVNRIITGDFNGDGALDIFIATAGQDPYVNGLPAQTGYVGELSQMLLQTPAGFRLAKIGNNLKAFAHHATAADINGDSLPDIFVASLVFASPFFVMGDANGDFKTDSTRFPVNFFGGAKKVLEIFENSVQKKWESMLFTSSAFLDANNDGKMDIALMAMSGTKTSIVMLNDGTGKFSPDRMIELPVGPYGPGYAFRKNQGETKYTEVGTIHLDTVAVDINNDGRTDIISLTTSAAELANEVVYYRGAALQILINTGNGFVDESRSRTSFVHSPGRNYTHYDTVEYSDVNNDKCPDLLLHRNPAVDSDGAMPTRILLNDCKGNFTETAYPRTLPAGVLTSLGQGQYAILVNQKRTPGFVQRVDHVKYDWTLGKSLFN